MHTYQYLFEKPKNVKIIIIILLNVLTMTIVVRNQKYSPIGTNYLNNHIIFGAGFGCENENMDQGRSYVDKNVDISNCFFSRSLEYSGDGGVICINSGSYSMSINYSMFNNCVCSSKGGAIYFDSPNSYLRMICANRCSCGASSYGGNFAYILVSQVNHLEYLSVSYCSHTTSGNGVTYSYYGNQKVDNTNNSLNSAKQLSGVRTYGSSSFTSSHCTFSNNNVSNNMCISFCSSSGTISMIFANIVHNNSPSGHGIVTVDGAGLKKMMYCIFQQNQNYLFSGYGGYLEVSHSFISHSELSFFTSTAVSTETNNSITNRSTYQFQFFNSHYCNADIALPERTLDHSPMKSLEKTIIRTNQETLKMTFGRTIDQTIRETLLNTHNKSPMNTLKETPINTHEQTMKETQKETPYRSYDECIFTSQMANQREISLVFSFLYLYYF